MIKLFDDEYLEKTNFMVKQMMMMIFMRRENNMQSKVKIFVYDQILFDKLNVGILSQFGKIMYFTKIRIYFILD